jgi:hypothetical protein
MQTTIAPRKPTHRALSTASTNGEPVRTFAGKTFTGTSGPSVLAAAYTGTYLAGKVEVECATESSTGEIAGAAELRAVQLAFQGCATVTSNLPCTNNSNPPGTVTFNTLKGKLGYISGAGTAAPIVGVVLTPEIAAPRPRPFVEFQCGTFTIVIGIATHASECFYPHPPSKCAGDGIISAINPIDQMTTAFTQSYTTATGGVENIP